MRNTMGIWQRFNHGKLLYKHKRFKLQECQHGLQCWSREGRSFLRWGETSTHFWMGGLQTICFTCMNLTFYFYPPYLCSVMPILYRSFSCTPRNPSLHPFQIPFPENLHLSMLNELWMVLYNQEKSTSLISSPWHSKSRFPPYESWFKDVTTGTPHLDAKVWVSCRCE